MRDLCAANQLMEGGCAERAGPTPAGSASSIGDDAVVLVGCDAVPPSCV